MIPETVKLMVHDGEPVVSKLWNIDLGPPGEGCHNLREAGAGYYGHPTAGYSDDVLLRAAEPSNQPTRSGIGCPVDGHANAHTLSKSANRARTTPSWNNSGI